MNGTSVFEVIPNVSEGRDAATIEACARAIVDAGGHLAHRTSDAVHNRSVFTYFGSRERAVAAAVALAGVARERIDLREHRGAHPRIGALDVLPFVPMRDATLADAIEVAREAAAAIWNAQKIPSFFYAAAATRTERTSLADVRRGEFEGLGERARAGERPDTGSSFAHPSAGAIAIGAREPLIAFNVELQTGEVAVAKAIARELRERDGGLRSLRALGIALAADRVQVSCNLTDVRAIPLDRLVALIERAAARRGVALGCSELIGLVPRAALAAVAARAFELDGIEGVARAPEGRPVAAQ